jgi:MFS family permease
MNNEPSNHQPRPGSLILRVLGDHNFRWLWIGEWVSNLGTQFYMIALPWLVLKLTGDTFALGSVMGLAGVPRALLLLVGGALTDYFSARSLMLASNVARFALVSLLALLVWGGHVQLWMLYGLVFLFGLADAFFYPALFAILPQILDAKYLHSGNAIIQGVSQVAVAAGPVLAGLMITLLGGPPPSSQVAGQADTLPVAADALSTSSIGLAFAVNSLTFLVSVTTLWIIRVHHSGNTVEGTNLYLGVLSSIKDGLVYVWKDRTLRMMFALAAALSLLGEGPVFVGVPVLADTRLPEGAAAFGIIMSCFGLGSLLGILLAGSLPRPTPREMAVLLPVACGLPGLGMVTFALAATTPPIAFAALVMGAGLGYMIVLITTWLQQRTPEHLMGRMMSFLMLAVVGTIPISMTLAGVALNYGTYFLFLGAGLIIMVIAVWAWRSPALRVIGEVWP